jgi:hypothetical protein
MSTPQEKTSPLVRFFDTFLEEKNIKWLLGVGAILVLGSSMRLIGSHWTEYPPVWKYLVIMAYTAVTFLVSEVAYWQLALRKTGTALMVLTVLLLPISFFALHWVEPTQNVSLDYFAMHLPIVVLLGGNLVLGYFAARRIFAHFLRGDQPTFVACYLILCAAGALLPALPGSWTPWVGLTLWGVVTAGVVKVNRHVFWLAEEHRLPRIVGFFPVILLMAQFIALVAIHLARFVPQYLPFQWLGLALVLVAVPVLLTADAVARVYEQRTGGLLPSLPWNIAAPLGCGLLLIVAGVCLSSIGMPRPFALPPTAAVAASLVLIVARRTQSKPLVWAMLLAIITAYNFSPLFFQEFARTVVQQGAHSVHESSLPYAFYGLTYLPLILVFSFASQIASRRGSELFAQPLRVAAQGLAVLLLMASCGHSKAMFPVGLVMIGVFALQATLFRARWLIASGMAALVIAGIGWTVFARDVLQLEVTFETPYLAMATVSALLLVSARWLDRVGASFCQPLKPDRPSENGANAWPICRYASLLAATLTVGVLIAITLLNIALGPAKVYAFPYAAATCLCGLLLIQALAWLLPLVGELALVSPMAFALLRGIERGESVEGLVFGMTVGLIVLWLYSYMELVAPKLRITRGLARPAYRVSLVGLSLLTVVYYAPQLMLAHVFGVDDLPWLSLLAVTAWNFDVRRRAETMGVSAVACFLTLGLSSATVAATLGVTLGAPWYATAWASVSCLTLLSIIPLRRRFMQQALATHGDIATGKSVYPWQSLVETPYAIARLVLGAIFIGTLLSISTPARVAGGIALFALSAQALFAGESRPWRHWLMMANWQMFPLVMQLCQPNSHWIWQATGAQCIDCALPLALCAAVGRLLIEHPLFSEDGKQTELVQSHCALLELIAAVFLLISLFQPDTAFGIALVILALASFAALAGVQLVRACREGSEIRVWYAMAIVALSVLYLAIPGIIHFGRGFSSYCVLAAGVSTWTLGRLASRNQRTAVMSGPFEFVGLTLPLGTVVIGMVRHVLGTPTLWHGMNSLALLLSAGFYFWQGVERQQKEFVVGAALIVNVALALLWRELAWSDPQWFMIPAGVSILFLVEFLKREIPAPYVNPLRYLGALVILVSPTFYIVEGSWPHLVSLMVASVAIVLLSIGIRVRALMYTGTAFLLADIVAMVVRESVERPNLLWIVGITLGGGVIAIAAAAENHREVLLQRVRLLAATIGAWE